MINLSKLTAILAEHKLSAEQSEELQKVIYGLDDGNIIELANMPCAGDTAYVYFKTINGHSRLLTVEYKGSFKKYTKDNKKYTVQTFINKPITDKQIEETKKDMEKENVLYGLIVTNMEVDKKTKEKAEKSRITILDKSNLKKGIYN